ncbi:hypothetical protein MHK_004962 [Candidatus Magnetomorum sp. HK-1]|nr:hypothetical protein MHK_004962 [Candidatus Magnetomorum sp. HK-1]
MNNDIEYQKTWKLLQELIEAGKETDKRMNKTDQKIDKLQKLIGGIGNSNGFVAEDLFYNSFSKMMSIGNMKFEYIDRNVERKHKGIEDEFDIVLTNSEIIVIVEVKYNFYPNDVEKVLTKIQNYKALFPLYKNYKFIGAIAGLTIQKETIYKAKKYGFFVVTQEGNDLKILNDKVKNV